MDLERHCTAFIERWLGAGAQARTAMRGDGEVLARAIHRKAVDLAYSKATEHSPKISLYMSLAAKVALLALGPDSADLEMYERDIRYYARFESTRPLVEDYEQFRLAVTAKAEPRREHDRGDVVEAEVLRRALAAIGHDLKNIFTPIVLSGELAQRSAGDADRCIALLDRVLSAARSGSDLVQRLARFVEERPAGRTSRRLSPILAEAVDSLEPSLPLGVAIQRSLLSEGDVAFFDPSQIREMVTSLLGNAVEALSDRGGKLAIGARSVERSQPRDATRGRLEPGAYLEIWVTDNGPGIDPEHRDRVFEPFFSTKHTGYGNGLGLALALDVVRRHGGAIDIDSELGVGTTVSVFLPQSDGAAGKSVAPETQGAD